MKTNYMIMILKKNSLHCMFIESVDVNNKVEFTTDSLFAGICRDEDYEQLKKIQQAFKEEYGDEYKVMAIDIYV